MRRFHNSLPWNSLEWCKELNRCPICPIIRTRIIKMPKELKSWPQNKMMPRRFRHMKMQLLRLRILNICEKWRKVRSMCSLRLGRVLAAPNSVYSLWSSVENWVTMNWSSMRETTRIRPLSQLPRASGLRCLKMSVGFATSGNTQWYSSIGDRQDSFTPKWRIKRKLSS